MNNLYYIPYNSSLIDYAKENRRNATRQEGIFWNVVLKHKKLHGYKFRRQKAIGSFILDFYCPKLLLGIEIDGGYHNETQTYDKVRDSEIYRKGIHIIRFTNEEINKNLEGVISYLEEKIVDREKELGIFSPDIFLPGQGELFCRRLVGVVSVVHTTPQSRYARQLPCQGANFSINFLFIFDF